MPAAASAAPAAVAVVSESNIDAVRAYLLGLQANIVSELERVGDEPFLTDEWTRAEGGGGLSRLIEGAQLFERAGVLFSHVKGQTLPPSATAHRPEVAGRPWEAMGVSMVLHPRNPYIPTTHLNVRMFVAKAPTGSGLADVFWFGGGMDLTPYYVFEDDAQHFHRATKNGAMNTFFLNTVTKHVGWVASFLTI